MNTRLASLWLRLPMAVPAFVLILCLALLPVSSASAQTSTTGNIEGTVTDTTGTAVPGVTVSASREGGSGSASTKTNDEGLFRLMIPPGKYTLKIDAAPGFARFEKQNVEVNLSKTTKLNVSLNPALVSGPVTVTQTSATTTPTPTSSNADDRQKTSSVQTIGGLHVVTFTLPEGRIKLNLPDDMRAGDTISGTVVTEPRGTNSEEKAKNDEALKVYVIDIQGSRSPVGNDGFTFDAPLAQPQVGEGNRSNEGKMDLGLFSGASLWGKAVVPYRTPSGAVVTPDPVQKTPSGAVVTPDPKFTIPNLGQQGRPIVINGPFDGNASNTTLRYGPADRTVHEFVKQSDNISEGSGFLRTLAESPRKIVFESPTNVTGSIGIMVKEGDGTPTKGTYRNVGVNLSAPKTNLLKGEKTTLTVQVSGLEGIKEPVPLTLESKGVITMEGGIYQPLIIQPSQVGADGRYTTTRGITGVQTGGWEATATVVTGRFNVWLQDDTDPNRIFHFNSLTGDYVFACGGGSCRTGGTGGTSSQPPTGSSAPPPPVTLTGIGKPAMKGCIITLSHNAPDRRVFAKLDACTKTGDASVETKSPKANFNITDKNTTDNTAQSPPK